MRFFAPRRSYLLTEHLLQPGKPGSVVTVNADKPRKGAFVVRVGEETVVSLLALPRPFTKLRELDMEATAAKVLELL